MSNETEETTNIAKCITCMHWRNNKCYWDYSCDYSVDCDGRKCERITECSVDLENYEDVILNCIKYETASNSTPDLQEDKIEDEPEKASPTEIFPVEITLAKSNLGSITLPIELAKKLEEAYKLDMLIEARAKQNSTLKDEVLSYMQEERLSELNSCYYDFYLHFEKKPRRLDATKLKEIEPEIYNKYLKGGSEKCSITMSKTAGGK